MSETNDQRWNKIYEAMTGATAPGHHEAPVGTRPESIKAGHEADVFDSKGIIMVPILVVVVTFLSYVLVTTTFRWLEVGKDQYDPTMSPLATAPNQKPFNERIERISSTDPKAEVHQPRLEYLKVMNQKRDGQEKPDPIFFRSFEASPKNNTYELKPQDLYPAYFVDPMTGKKLLSEYDWVAKDKHVARIPVNEAIKLLAGKLPANKDGKAPAVNTDKPKASNGGQVGK